MAQRYELARPRVCLHRHRVIFKSVLDLHDVFAKEEETPRWEFSLGSFRVAHGSGGSDCGQGEVLQTERILRLGPRHVEREFRVTSSNPLVQRFPSNPALSAASSPSHIQKYGVDLALMREIPNPLAGRARYPFCLVCSHPMGTPPHG